MYIFCFKIFHNFFIYQPILFKIEFKNNRVLLLTNTKLQSKFQYNRMFASSVIVLTRNVTDGRMDGQTDILKVVQNLTTNIMAMNIFFYERYLRF